MITDYLFHKCHILTRSHILQHTSQYAPKQANKNSIYRHFFWLPNHTYIITFSDMFMWNFAGLQIVLNLLWTVREDVWCFYCVLRNSVDCSLSKQPVCYGWGSGSQKYTCVKVYTLLCCHMEGWRGWFTGLRCVGGWPNNLSDSCFNDLPDLYLG